LDETPGGPEAKSRTDLFQRLLPEGQRLVNEAETRVALGADDYDRRRSRPRHAQLRVPLADPRENCDENEGARER